MREWRRKGGSGGGREGVEEGGSEGVEEGGREWKREGGRERGIQTAASEPYCC